MSFEIDMDLKDIIICHCSICRRWSGTNGIAVSIIPADRFRWTAGESEVTYWKKPDGDWQSAFCATCGSALPGANDDKSFFVPVGLLPEDIEDLRVSHHIWVDSKADWDEIGDDGKQHLTKYKG
ncbi:MAG: GFA family protein [Pseudomonadota bacterium]